MKKKGHHARKKDIMGQSYLIYACSGTNHARYFIGPHYILRELEAKLIKVILQKKNPR